MKDLVRMSKSILKPSINPAEYDFEDYYYRQNSLANYYNEEEEEEEEDRQYDMKNDHRDDDRPRDVTPRRYSGHYRQG